MRLNISFLQKTPIWVFFCFCAVCLLCVPVESHATVAGSFSSGDYLALNQTMNDFENAARTWQNTFQGAAEALFLMLIPIAMVWRFGQIAMQGGGATEALAELVRFLVFAGFYWWLVKNGCKIAETILESMQDLSDDALGQQRTGLDPTAVINLGLNTLRDVIGASKFTLNIGTDLTLLAVIVVTIIFACLCAVVAINLLLAIITVYILMYAGIIILGFGATSWTSEMAIGYFRSVFNASMRVAGMMLVVGICESVVETISQRVLSADNKLFVAVELLITALMMYLMTEKVPDQLSSLASGSLGNHAAVSNAGSFATAQMAAGLAISAATGGAGLAAKGAVTAAKGAGIAAKGVSAAAKGIGNAAADITSRMFSRSGSGESGNSGMGSIKGSSSSMPPSAAKPAQNAPPSDANDDSSHYIHGVDFANLKYPNPNAPPPSND